MSVAGGNTIVALICVGLFIILPMVASHYQQNELEARVEELEARSVRPWTDVLKTEYGRLREIR